MKTLLIIITLSLFYIGCDSTTQPTQLGIDGEWFRSSKTDSLKYMHEYVNFNTDSTCLMLAYFSDNQHFEIKNTFPESPYSTRTYTVSYEVESDSLIHFEVDIGNTMTFIYNNQSLKSCPNDKCHYYSRSPSQAAQQVE